MSVHVRRRDDGHLELRVNGVFVMDDAETSSERMLGSLTCDSGAARVLVGGLGLGFTLREILTRPPESVTVVEREQDIVDLMHAGHIPGADLLEHPSVTVVVDDIVAVLGRSHEASLDAIALDVDNGPDFLVHDDNTEIYHDDVLGQCAQLLRPGGQLLIWSMADSPELRSRLARIFTTVETHRIPVTLGARETDYWLLVGRLSATTAV